jgi:hypothetical protein
VALIDVERLRLSAASSNFGALIWCKSVFVRTLRGSGRRHSDDRGKYNTKKRVSMREQVGFSGSRTEIITLRLCAKA